MEVQEYEIFRREEIREEVIRDLLGERFASSAKDIRIKPAIEEEVEKRRREEQLCQ